ncbi:phosphotransferase [Mycobacterium sp. CBMA 234]|uniref:phosphotransferase family protein n=1 Tax=Mycolicibacterium sp. CBMA 234 TaxID=1918495 RepID=UPI0012DE49FC|nr:phosphotransferase family protein [Mycolicibacterium sp. CBMA 234]MUL65885.1 phosphotransferase [Mycolicibacterium sp. CBMA 234]
MALINTTDQSAVADRLVAALGRNLRDVEDIEVGTVTMPQSSGLSNETILFAASWKDNGRTVNRRLVARVAPTGPAMFPSYDLRRESRVIGALNSRSTVPVPEALFYEDDSSLLGAPFIVMGHVDGRAAADDPPFTVSGWVMELAPHERAQMADNGLKALAAIHQVDWRGVGLGDLDRSDAHRSSLDVVLEDLRSCYQWAADGRTNITVEAGLDWLADQRPTREPSSVLCWGDARFGNLLIKDNLTVSAVLDWEMTGVGAPELDLGWWLFLFRHHTEGIGVPIPEGFPEANAVVERYEELTSCRVPDIHYYEMLAAVRLSILTQRATTLLIDAGILPVDAPMMLNNPATNLLAAMADLPSPGGMTATPMTRGK